MMKPKLGSGARFKHLEHELEGKGARDPAALAAFIGRKRYGAKKFAAMGHARGGPVGQATEGMDVEYPYSFGGPIGQQTEGMDSARRYMHGGPVGQSTEGMDTSPVDGEEDDGMGDDEEEGERCEACGGLMAAGGMVHGKQQTPAGGPMSFHDAMMMQKNAKRGSHFGKLRPGPQG